MMYLLKEEVLLGLSRLLVILNLTSLLEKETTSLMLSMLLNHLDGLVL